MNFYSEIQESTKIEECNANSENNIHNARHIISQIKEGNPFPRIVQVYFFVWKVLEIDTVNECFSLDVTISFSWLEDNPVKNIKPISPDDDSSWNLSDFLWQPQLRFPNMLSKEDSLHEQWVRVSDHTKDGPETGHNIRKSEWRDGQNRPHCVKVTYSQKLSAKFSESMELDEFPFDSQGLNLEITSSWDCKNVIFSISDECQVKGNLNISSEWNILGTPRCFAINKMRKVDGSENHQLLSEAKTSKTGVQYSRVYVGVTAVRIPTFYIWNVFFMIFILGTLSFCSFQTKLETAFDDRLSNLLTLVLAIVAFKLVLADHLPAVSYLTMMDNYTLQALAILFIMSLGSAVILSLSTLIAFESDGFNESYFIEIGDRVLLIVCGAWWTGTNLFFVTRMLKLYLLRTRPAILERNAELLLEKSSAANLNERSTDLSSLEQEIDIEMKKRFK